MKIEEQAFPTLPVGPPEERPKTVQAKPLIEDELPILGQLEESKASEAAKKGGAKGKKRGGGQALELRPGFF